MKIKVTRYQIYLPKIFVGLLLLPSLGAAVPVKSKTMKPQAYFVQGNGDLFEPLDLKSKKFSFTKSDVELCGAGLVRRGLTLTFSCTLPLPSKAKISRLQNMVTAKKVKVDFGGSMREVEYQVSDDARSLTLTTAFDHTGIDFEVSKFNDDFFAVYAKVAQLVIGDALHKQSLLIEVLESR